MFSVIIPLYNKAPYIEKAIFSVLNQSFQEFEVIVLDDGSTDDSWICLQNVIIQVQKKYPDLYSKITILQQNNKGVSATRNIGVAIAKYDYIAFLDADDWWSNFFLEKMNGLISQFPDAGIYGSSYYKVKNKINYTAKIGVEENFSFGYFNYFKVYSNSLWMPLWTSAVVIPKSIYTKFNGFKEELLFGEDFDLWVRIALKYRTVLVNKPLAYYNQDVDEKNRAVVSNKLYSPQFHYIFNIDYLQEEENKNLDLKLLLDKLRLYVLYPYYLDRKYRQIAKEELQKINWNKVSKLERFKYHTPVLLQKIIYEIRKCISIVKNLILNYLL